MITFKIEEVNKSIRGDGDLKRIVTKFNGKYLLHKNCVKHTMCNKYNSNSKVYKK